MLSAPTATRFAFALAPIVALAFAVDERATLHADPLLLDDPIVLTELEDRGLSFQHVVGAEARIAIARVVEEDIAELTHGHAPDDARRPFNPKWITRGRFELVGVVNRVDRRRFDASTSSCGEARLIYRLALKNRGRPTTRLPMTVNVRIPQPKTRGLTDCRDVANRWIAKEDVVAIVSDLLSQNGGHAGQIEVNFQSLHAPGARLDMDDSAGYVQRSFAVKSKSEIVVDGLFNTPRQDANKDVLIRWVRDHVREIDDGAAVLPAELLAKRVISVSPRGLVHAANRPFSSIIKASDLVASMPPLHDRERTKTPELLLRRLDEMTCTGCHQSRGVAGFHLLGEERSTASFNTLAVGHSPHVASDLAWRVTDLASASRGEIGASRPFATDPKGELGDDCGLIPGLASWSCKPGFVCRDIHHGEVGICARGNSSAPGAPCEDIASFVPSDRAEGPIVTANKPDATCPAPVGEQSTGAFCAPNWLGFTGGMCSERCDEHDVGKQRADGTAICAPLPAAGYESDCFLSKEPIESCLSRHFVTAYVASCDAHRLCRGDYGCARVPNAPRDVGACVPPYFIFQARVDGPLLDR